jgi:ribonuclease P protein subunit RPR2
VETSAAADLDATRRQLLVFAGDLQRSVTRERQRREEVEIAYRELSSGYLGMVSALADACEAKDAYTRGHLDRTYRYALLLTRRVAPELAERAEVGFGYLLHDIGKIGVPEAILHKPVPLTDEEWETMRTHPIIGESLVEPLRLLGDALGVIRSHHERWDGHGYPDGLAGEDIYLPARIFAVADTFDAITTDRPYRAARSVEWALEEIDRHAGTQFDPEVAAAWVAAVEELGSTSAGALTLPA